MIMKNISILISCMCVVLWHCNPSDSVQYHQDELLFVVEMDSNQGKSKAAIAAFSEFYTEAVKTTETHTLGWGFYDTGDHIILIERYLNDDAMMQHGKNIGEGGALEAHFLKFMDHFTINKIDVYGHASETLKAFVAPFGLPFHFHEPHAKFSRSSS